jgi:hypothetical protein
MIDPLQKQFLTGVLHALDYDFTRFAVLDFVQHIATLRLRPIRVGQCALSDDLFGAFIPKPQVDFLLVNESLHPVHQAHTLLHELAHLLFDHPRLSLTPYLPAEVIQSLDLLASPIEGVPRFAFDSAAAMPPWEREAEQFSYVVQHQVHRARRWHELTAPSSISTLVSVMTMTA